MTRNHGRNGVHLFAGFDKDEELADSRCSYSASHVPRSCSLPEGIVLPPGLTLPNRRVRGYSATMLLDTSDGIYIGPLKEALPAGSSRSWRQLAAGSLPSLSKLWTILTWFWLSQSLFKAVLMCIHLTTVLIHFF